MKAIIGLEIHVQLKTLSKMFCSCSAEYFGHEPNTHMCPVCLALPGALPKANKKAIENAAKVGLALHCHVNEFSKFDRKNYMYPDLFKGYQITQYEIPICENGYVDVRKPDGSVVRVGIIRAHQEEDTAKSIHEDGYTLVDGNKAGVPLLEIVSAPDMSTVEEARLFAEQIYNIIRFIGVSDADMEKGQMRFDVNVNVQLEEKNDQGEVETVATPIVEIKNLNSFRSMERALEYEIERQTKEFKETKIKFAKGNKTTRGWSDDRGETYLLRSKEEAEDYRYFPDPDLPPVILTPEQIEQFRKEIGKLPPEIYQEYTEGLGMHPETAEFFTTQKNFYEYLESGKAMYANTLNLANWIKGPLVFSLHFGDTPQDKFAIESALPIRNLITLLEEIDRGTISNSAGKEVLAEMVKSGKGATNIIEEKGLRQVSDAGEIGGIIDTVIAANESAVANFRSGKAGALMFLVGQVMKEMKGRGNPGVIKKIIEDKLH